MQVLTSLNDAGVLPSLSKPRKSALVCALMGLTGLLFVTRVGSHWLELFDAFSVNISLFACGLLECVGVGWVYGADNFAAEALSMTGRRLPKPLLAMYKYVIPLLLTILVLSTLVSAFTSTYPFPPEGVACGVLLACCSSAPLACSLCAHAVRQWRKRRAARQRRTARAPPRITEHACTSFAATTTTAAAEELSAVAVEMRSPAAHNATTDLAPSTPAGKAAAGGSVDATTPV